jgi:predicted nucleic acid-binding protein
MKAVLDANILVARFVPEETAHEECLRLIQVCREAEIKVVVPLLFPAEVTGAIGRITGNEGAAQRALHILHSYPWLRVRLADTRFVEQTAILAARHSLRGADAFYLTVAAEQRCPLITLDEELLTRAPEKVAVMRPGAWLAMLGR